MKKIYSLLAVLFCTTAFAQMMNLPKDTLIKYDKATAEKIIKESPYIFEGTLVKKENAFCVNNGAVYTPNIIQVNKILKGQNLKLGTVEVIMQEGSAEGTDGWVHMTTDPFDSPGYIKLYSYEQPIMFFCISADSSIKQKPEKIINTDNTIRLQPKEWYTTTIILLPKADGNTSWMNLSFKNKKELYDFLSKYENITIPKEEPVEKKSEDVKPTKAEADSIKQAQNKLLYEQRKKNYEQYMEQRMKVIDAKQKKK